MDKLLVNALNKAIDTGLLLPCDSATTPQYFMFDVKHMNADKIKLAVYRDGLHSWSLTGYDSKNKAWYNLGDRPDLKLPYVANLVNSWRNDLDSLTHGFENPFDWLTALIDAAVENMQSDDPNQALRVPLNPAIIHECRGQAYDVVKDGEKFIAKMPTPLADYSQSFDDFDDAAIHLAHLRQKHTSGMHWNFKKRNDIAQALYNALADTPVENDEIDQQFLHFDIGTDVTDIWHWFEEYFDLSVMNDLISPI